MNVSRQSDKQVVFIYSADISLAIGDNIHTIVTLDNHTFWSSNSSLYYQFEPVQYYDGWHNIFSKCPTMNSTCNLTIYDGVGYYEIPLSLEGRDLYPSFTDFLIFDQGSVFFEVGPLFDPVSLACYGSQEIVLQGPPFNTNFNYCCNAFDYVDIPDNNTNSCIEFNGNSTLFTSDGKITSSFSADYIVGNAGINISVTNFTSSISSIVYDFIPNDAIGSGCAGKSNANCTFYLPINQNYKDYQFDMMLSIFDQTQTYGITIAGKVMRRNGILVRHRNEVYTPSDPCWIRSFPS
uniref:Uncharacterized protein n=1 Tax=Panagrolaimus sp. ES5 TaxID=591445 RepID=A0AC34FLG6_9BILA